MSACSHVMQTACSVKGIAMPIALTLALDGRTGALGCWTGAHMVACTASCAVAECAARWRSDDPARSIVRAFGDGHVLAHAFSPCMQALVQTLRAVMCVGILN